MGAYNERGKNPGSDAANTREGPSDRRERMDTTAHQLVSGQAEIDRMRKEIVFVTNCLAGFVKNSDCHPNSNFRYGKASLTKADGDLEWEVETIPFSGGNVSIRCRGSEGDLILSTRSLLPVPLQYVKRVHRSLDVLLQKMLHDFPVLKQRLQPLLDAAASE